MKTQEAFKKYFSTAYQGSEDFVQNVIFPIFGEDNYKESYEYDVLTENKDLKKLADRSGIVSVKAIGSIEITAYSIQVFDIQVRENMQLGRSKVNIQAVVRRITETYQGAFMIFHHLDNVSEWRFSFFDRGADNKEVTSAKRYTYLVGEGQQCRTVAERFEKLAQINKIKRTDIIEAFSVESLSKEFYNELFAWYQWVLSEQVGITFPNNIDNPDDDRWKLEEQVIRLITRLLFVWFIKQKGLVPDILFKEKNLSEILKEFQPESAEQGNYYNAILQNLFFATLNKAISERGFAKLKNKRDIKTLYRYAEMFQEESEDKILSLFTPVPFLNGGLFECLDKEISTDGVRYHLDGFSRNDKKSANGHFKYRAFIPNIVFFDKQKGIIPLLKKYNFTVEENSPSEVQVALDPELLGNVFENLLGAYNPETKESARKQSGSFYTPKDVVAYMVDESLKVYLEQALEGYPTISQEVVEQLFESDSLPEVLEQNHDLCEGVAEKLRAVKILDPACGSGAFPMGILNRMVEILEKLDARNEKTIYEQKLHLIEKCIYGVDIQTIASQISKLRFFISLIVEQESKLDIDNAAQNYNIKTLPNLETKFVTANTLLGVKKKNIQLNLFENTEIEDTKQELLTIRKNHFYAQTAHSKKQLREQDAKLREKLIKLLKENHEFAPEDAIQFSHWNPYDQNASSPFFDPDWMFGIEQGFDIVIGNPPYIQLMKDGGALSKIYEKCNFQTFVRTGDIYQLFYERGWQLLKEKGTLCYITSNKWMRAGYGEKTRKFFAEKTNPKILIDFAGQKIFESATVDTNILLFAKEKNTFKTKACVIKESVLNKLSDYFNQKASICNFSSESWIILSEIEKSIKEKIEAIGTPLKDWDINIYRGILTGYNEAFIINGEKKDELIAQDPKSAEIIRPLLRGRDIKRYSYEFADLYLICTFPSLKIDIEEYPAVKEHLLSFGKERLEQSGKTHEINGKRIKSRKKTNNKWFETQDSISYWEDFYK
ncbi:Eco57I restriction-modification methylase domain-containing protein, partial [Ornithobacterium rhinotracheale]|uniref:Eco57I restriction-modification methylase domain-containing protein n=2 Tax=Ornithobacterium rhinotracheale TaxID=28251 RepID=UPI0040358AC1